MENVTKTVIDCIKYEICRQKEKIVLPEVSARFLIDVYKLSKAHDVAHLVGDALNKNGVFENFPDDIDENERAAIAKVKEKFDEQIFTAVYRYENINYELERLKETLEEAEIPFIPLKGSVIRKYYPEPWMRTSCDIDILVHEEDLERAKKAICEKLGYAFEGRHYHDISMFSQSGVHLELHFHLKETISGIDAVLMRAWEFAALKAGKKYEHEFSNEFLAFQLAAHNSYHFQHGGCGIRPFIDFQVLENSGEFTYDEEKLNELLRGGGIYKFYLETKALAEVWFCGAEHTELTKKIELYVLDGGVYGSMKNSLAMRQSKKRGKLGYAMSRIFLPYDTLKNYYPTLQKHKWLLPFFEVKRWFEILFSPRLKNGINELSESNKITQEDREKMKNLLDELELQD